MTERLRIHRAGLPDAETPLKREPTSLGRAADCQVRIDHPEIGPRVATLDYRGGACFVQNLCPYEVYLGPRPVPPQGWAEWPANEELRLSKSVSLTRIVDAAVAGGAAAGGAAAAVPAEEISPAAAAAQKRKTWIQIGVILVCAVLGAVLLTTDRGPAYTQHDDFPTLIELLRNQPQSRGVHDDNRIRDYLQTAWLLDRRCRANKGSSAHARAEAIRFYHVLLSEPRLLLNDPLDDHDVYSRVKVFAEQRVAELSKAE